MITFDKGITKDQFIAELQEHAFHDQFIQSGYEGGVWSDFRGCEDNRTLFESRLGVPEWLAHVIYGIFDGLPQELAMTWPARVMDAIPEGVSCEKLDSVRTNWLIRILQAGLKRVEVLDIDDSLKRTVLTAIQGVIDAMLSGVGLDGAATRAADAARHTSNAYRDAHSAVIAADSAAYAASEAFAAFFAAASAAYAASATWSEMSDWLIVELKNVQGGNKQ